MRRNHGHPPHQRLIRGPCSWFLSRWNYPQRRGTRPFIVARHNGEEYDEVELWRAKGELTLAQCSVQSLTSQAASGAMQEAEGCFLHAIEIARHQSAKSLEPRAVMHLSHLWQSQGRREEAQQLLAEMYGWFAEGFNTEDLQEAKALLADLGRSSRPGDV